MKVEKNNNSIFRNKHVLIVVAVLCIFTIIACMGFMLSVPAHAEENIAPKTEPIAFSTPIETVNELDEAFPMMETSEEAQEEITTAGAEVEFSDAAEPEPQIETAEAAIEEPEPETETIPDNLDDNELEIYTALRSAGLSKAGTAAVMGCMTMESGLNASAENPSDGGYGLLQWTYSRKSDLFNWCYAAGSRFWCMSFRAHTARPPSTRIRCMKLSRPATAWKIAFRCSSPIWKREPTWQSLPAKSMQVA